MVAILVAAVSGLLDAISRVIVPLPEELSGSALASPLLIAALQLLSFLVIGVLLFRVGRVFGGYGSQLDAFKATIWVSLAGLVLSVVALLLMTISPGIAALFQFATVLWMLGLFTIFTQTLHGFQNFFTTLAGILGTMFALATVIVMVLSLLGILPGMA